MFPHNSSVTRRLPFLLTGSLGSVSPLSNGTMKALRLPMSHQSGFVCSSPTPTPLAASFVSCRSPDSSMPQPLPARHRQGVGLPVAPSSGYGVRGTHWISQLPRQSLACMPRSRTPARPSHLAICGASVLSPESQTPRTHAMRQFRGSIARLHARCVRFMPPSRTTMQHSLRCSGQDFIVPGLSPRRTASEWFQFLTSPFL